MWYKVSCLRAPLRKGIDVVRYFFYLQTPGSLVGLFRSVDMIKRRIDKYLPRVTQEKNTEVKVGNTVLSHYGPKMKESW